MTLAKTQAAAQPTAVFNTLEEILAPETLYATNAKRRAILNVTAELDFGSLQMALPNAIVMAKPTLFNKGSLLALSQISQINLHLLQIHPILPHLILPLPCSSHPGMDLLRQILSGRFNHNHLHHRDHRDLIVMHISYWLVPHMSMTEIN
jgi:hypothetical protein